MGYKLITQIVLMIASLVIIFTFIQPSFNDIKKTQDQLFQYKDTIAKASQFNARLQELIGIRDSIPADAMKTLERFVPTTIDSLNVMRDIENIFSINSVTINSLTASEEVTPTTDVNFQGAEVTKPGVPELSFQDFEVNFTTTYKQMKDILLFIESNVSLLEVTEFEFVTVDKSASDGQITQSSDNGIYTFNMKLRAYGLTKTKN